MLDNASIMKEVAPKSEDINQRIARRVARCRANAGLSLDALAARSGVSRSTISLIERGETSATAVVLDRTTHDAMNIFKAAVQVRPEILECHLVAGGFDYLIKTRVADMQAYRGFVGSVIWALPGVRETRTYAVMEEVKNTTMLPI